MKGFCVNDKFPINNIEWTYSSMYSIPGKIVFQSYDANLCPMPMFSTWDKNDFYQKQIDRALEQTKYYPGEVWLDDVRII